MDGIGRQAKLIAFRLWTYLRYQATAVDAHALHSPFLFEWYRSLTAFDAKEPTRLHQHIIALSKDKTVLTRRDPGMGRSKRISVRSLYRRTKSDRRLRRLMHFQVGRLPRGAGILELGTCLGTVSLVLAEADTDRIWTVEGDPALVEYARKSWIQGSGLHLVEGRFEKVLKGVLEKMGSVDLVFLDGDHRGDAVLRNLDTIFPYLSDEALLIVDDIHWSPDMQRAWNAIRNDERFTITLDMFRFGIIFRRPSQAHQDFVLRY